MSDVKALAIGDRIARWKKILDLFKNVDFDKLLDLIGVISGPDASKWITLIRQVLDLFKQPAAQGAGDGDLHERLCSVYCAANVTEAEVDEFLRKAT